MIKNIIPTLAEVGKIKIGKKGPKRRSHGGAEFRIPMKSDRFTITKLARDQNEDFIPDKNLMDTVATLTGQEPNKITELPVRLLYDDIELNFPTRYACFKGTTCWCSGDGEKAQRIKNQHGEMEQVECPCHRQAPDYKQNDKCKATGVLQVVLEGVPVVGGVWKFRTTSFNSVTNILSSLTFIKSLTKGVLAGIPLYMVVAPKTVNIPGGGGVTTVYVVRIEYRGTTEQLVEIGYNEAQKRAVAAIKMDDIENQARLLVHKPMDSEEERDIADEFYPESAGDKETDTAPEEKTIKPGTEKTIDTEEDAGTGIYGPTKETPKDANTAAAPKDKTEAEPEPPPEETKDAEEEEKADGEHVEESPADIEKEEELVKVSKEDAAETWDQEHWKNLRAGDGVKTGFGAFVNENIDSFTLIPGTLRDAVRAKWAKLYPRKDFPVKVETAEPEQTAVHQGKFKGAEGSPPWETGEEDEKKESTVDQLNGSGLNNKEKARLCINEINNIKTTDDLTAWSVDVGNVAMKVLPEHFFNEVKRAFHDRVKELKAPPEPKQNEFTDCPDGRGNVHRTFCELECPDRKGCKAFN